MPILGTIASSRRSSAPTPIDAYDSIATVTPSGNTTAVFSSIPSTYKHLQIRFSTGADNSANFIQYNFNGDNTTTNYATHIIYVTGSTSISSFTATSTSGRAYHLFDVSNGSRGLTVGILDILDYTDSNKYKVSKLTYGFDNAGGYREHGTMSGLWMSTNAINNITFTLSSNFPANTVFALYGIKN